MRRILLYIILLVILFSGMNQIRGLLEKSNESVGSSYKGFKDSIVGWYSSATDKSKELKAKLSVKIQETNEKYKNLKTEIDTISKTIQEKKAQLEKSFAEMQEAKKALEQLLSSPESTKAPEPSGTPQ